MITSNVDIATDSGQLRLLHRQYLTMASFGPLNQFLPLVSTPLAGLLPRPEVCVGVRQSSVHGHLFLLTLTPSTNPSTGITSDGVCASKAQLV